MSDARLAFAERLPTQVEIENADQLREIMAAVIRDDADTTLRVVETARPLKSADVTLSPAIARTFLDILRLISSGRGFKLIPVDAELTTQEAADILNVSRPHLIKLLDSHAIPYDRVGRHRRIKVNDLFAFKAERDEVRAKALADMAAEDARLGLL